jgi:DNA-binding response OmpR family regulator
MAESALVVLSGVAADVHARILRELSSAGLAVRSGPSVAETNRDGNVFSLAAQVADIVRQCLTGAVPTTLLVVESGVPAETKILVFPLLTIHFDRRETLVENHLVVLSKGEFNLLHILASFPGRVFSREELVTHSRGIGYPVTERSIDVQITGLRKKLAAASQYVQTVRGVGYRFEAVPVQ